MKSWYMAGSEPQDYELGIDPHMSHAGQNSAYLKARVDQPKGFGTMMQMFQANNYLNKRMCFAAYVKSENVEFWAGLWMRIDGAERQQPLGFDNMRNRPIKGTTDWQKYEVVLDVPAESVNIAFGILLHGRGQVWLSGVQFEEVGSDVPTTGQRWPDAPGNLDFAED